MRWVGGRISPDRAPWAQSPSSPSSGFAFRPETFNRYVDGLVTWTPRDDHEMYDVMGKRMAHRGYIPAADG